MEAHKWYDLFAKYYDRSETSGDRQRRRLAIEQLNPRPGDVVLVPGCGTGLDFPLLVDAVGPGGRVIGLDYSKEMLRYAESLAEREGWANVTLIHEDARALSAGLLHEGAGVREVDGLLFTYVLTVVPDWESVFEKAYSLLRVGGRCVIADMKRPAGVARVLSPFLFVMRKLGVGDVRRRVDTLLRGRVDELHVSRTRWGVVAGGTKGTGWAGV